MVKVLAICGESPDHIYGGMGVHCRELYGAMTGASVTWLTPFDNYTNTKPYKIIHPTSPVYGDPVKGYERMQDHFHRLTVEGACQEFEVIHAHDWSAVPVALDLRRITGKPVVTTFHLFQDQVVRVEGLHITRTIALSIQMEAVGICESDEVIVCSQQMKRYVQEEFGYRNVSPTVIPNAVNAKEIQSAGTVWWACPKPIVLYCGRLSDQKGIKYILDLVEQTDEFMFVLLAGFPTDDPNPQHELDTRIRQLENQYPDRIKWVKHIDGPERFAWHRRADIGIMPSLCEPFGIAALEFMAAGCPLVTTGVDGMRDFVNDGNAFVYPVDEMLAGLRQAGISGREKIPAAKRTAERYSWEEIAKQTVEVYENVAS